MDLSNDVVIHVKDGDVEYLQFKKLLEFENIIHAYALKPLDFRTHFENDVCRSYNKLLEKFNVRLETLLRPYQTHTNNVISIKEKINKDIPDINLEYLNDIDGTITATGNITIATTNADCILLIFYDPINNVIANVHSGWRGTFKKIAQNTVRKMKREYKSNPENIIVCICPSIRTCHFEVEDDVKIECESIFEYTGKLKEIIKIGEIKEGKQKYFIDTVLITKILLEEEGIKPENIYDSNICSVCASEKVHSRRADGVDYGLGTAIIMKK